MIKKTAGLMFIPFIIVTLWLAGCSSLQSSSSQVPTAGPSASANRTKELDEILLKAVNSHNTLSDKLDILFKALSEDTYEHFTMYNCDEILSRTMNMFYEYLGTASAYDSSQSLERFPGVKVVPLETGRLVEFDGKPETFGESAEVRYLFYQYKDSSQVRVYKMYFPTYLRVFDSFSIQTDKDSVMVYLSGMTGMNYGARSFIQAFRISRDDCSRAVSLAPFTYNQKDLLDGDGILPEEFSIKKFTDQEILLLEEQNSEIKQLKAHFNKADELFSISANP